MKKIFLFLTVILIIFSCKKNASEEVDNFGEIVYTDSFSPGAWENPINREKIEAIDKDIGKIIQNDTIDPGLRNIINLIENFILYSTQKNFDKIKDILTSSAYNSFILRFPDININKKYYIRIAYPEQIEKERYWIQFKILFPAESIASRLEIEKSGSSLHISDFENNLFTDLEKIFK